jgi:hypothetical protein
MLALALCSGIRPEKLSPKSLGVCLIFALRASQTKHLPERELAGVAAISK